MSTSHRRTVAVGIALSALALTAAACASPTSGRSAGSSAGSPSTGTTTSVTSWPGTGQDTSIGCTAMVQVEATPPPGTDPDGPPPSAADLRAWAAKTKPALDLATANTQSQLADSFAVLQSALSGAERGTRVRADDPAIKDAFNAINAVIHDSCRFQTLDVANAEGALTGTPATLDAGPTAIEFINSTDRSTAAAVLLLARLKDGQSVSLADLESGAADIATVGDVLAVAQPTGATPAFATATLTRGHYVLLAPIGAPPAFTGTIGAEFDVV